MASTKISALLIGACLISTASYSNVRTVARTVSTFGDWHALSEGDKGKYKCVITTPGLNEGVSIAYNSPDQYLSIILIKPTWVLPPNTKVPVFIRMGNYRLNGNGISFNKHVVKIKLDRQNIEDFARHFSTDSRIYFTFENGNEPKWSANLKGGKEAIHWLKHCTRGVSPPKPNSSTPTQPFVPQTSSSSEPK
jgi:hypothetical protein